MNLCHKNFPYDHFPFFTCPVSVCFPFLSSLPYPIMLQHAKWTPSTLIARLGKEINNESSYLYWAYKVSLRSMLRSSVINVVQCYSSVPFRFKYFIFLLLILFALYSHCMLTFRNLEMKDARSGGHNYVTGECNFIN